jgi:sec-independent protein translocase protein TatB
MDFSLAEILLVVVVAVVFIGPKELPAVVRAIAKAVRWLKELTREIKKTFDALAEESGVKEITDTVNAELRLIKGDDGDMYESYDLSKLPTDSRHGG